MTAKLGGGDVSFRLGSSSVSAIYLGSAQVWSASAPGVTLYYLDSVGNNWDTLGNWWLDEAHTQPAAALPTSADSVVVGGTSTLDVTGKTVVNAATNSATFVGGTLTVTGTLTLGGTVGLGASVTGNVVFNGASINQGEITGNVVFNDLTGNFSTVNGDATFNDESYNFGTVTGTVTCNSPGPC